MLSDAEKKEFEHLKEKIEMNKLYGIDIYLNKEQVKIIENLIKEIEELKNGQIDFWISDKEIEERIRNKFVSKDKIKAKIEEIKDGTYDAKIVLQSLLEEE